MNWTDLLKSEMDMAYRAAEGLIDLVDDLDWKPATGDNWMTTGQLLEHITSSCGYVFRGFVSGEWKMPDGTDMADAPPDEMMTAEAMPSAESAEAAAAALRADKEMSLGLLEQADGRFDDPTPAPWNPQPAPLGQQMLMGVNHLNQHKGQLFYYLKLQGKPVNTMHYYGMGEEAAAT